MPWVRFTSDFDWSPPEKPGRITIAYKSGMQVLVRRLCAQAAVAAGAAQTINPQETLNG